MFKKLAEGIRRDNGGFTLIEVIVAMVIITIACLPLINSFLVSTKSNVKAQDLAEGTSLAQYVMDTLQAAGADEVKSQFWSAESVKDVTKPENFKVADDFTLFDVEPGDYMPTDSGYVKAPEGVPASGYSMYYYVKNIEFGSGKYNVQIEYDPESYGKESDKKYNVNSFPDIDMLGGSNTGIVDAVSQFMAVEKGEGKSYKDFNDEALRYSSYIYKEDESFEERAAGTFYNQYAKFYSDVAYALQKEVLKMYPGAKSATPTFSDMGAKDKSVIMPVIRENTDRTANITVNDADAGAYVYSCKGVYSLNVESVYGEKSAAINEIKAKAAIYLNGVHTGSIIRGDALTENDNLTETEKTAILTNLQKYLEGSDGTTGKYDSIIKEYAYDFKGETKTTVRPDNIYYMYAPLDSSKWGNDTLNVYVGSTNGGYDVSKLKVFVVPQIDLYTSSGTPLYNSAGTIRELKVKDFPSAKAELYCIRKTGAKEDTKGYITSNYDFVSSSSVLAAYIDGDVYTGLDANDYIVESRESEDIIYNITLKVFKVNNAGDSSDYVTKLNLAGN